jgi:ribulose-5-phosphate 4-epimerase/fuculose-1-phosphate aldolase
LIAAPVISVELAREIARACRALTVAGLFDMHGHLSVRDGDLLYVNGRQASRVSVRPKDVAVVRVSDGKAVVGEPPSELPLHLAAYRARGDVGSVAHFHPLAATAFAVAGRPLVTAFNAGTIFGERVPVFDEPDLIRTDDLGRPMAQALGKCRALLLRGHGVVVIGEDLPRCLTAALFLEENARRLSETIPLGEPRPYTEEEIARVRASLWQQSVIEKTFTDLIERARVAGVLNDLE